MEQLYTRLERNGCWSEYYDQLTRKSRYHDSKVSELPENRQFNRYLDVKAYDSSRVKLIRAENDYINANLVTVPKAARSYILTQGPLPETIGHFWLMILEQTSSLIVILNNITELESFKKCEKYWPLALDQPVEYEDVKLTITLKAVTDTKHFIIRKLLITDTQSEHPPRYVTQFHYIDWPDHGEPDSPISFLRLLAAVRKFGGLDKMDEPIVVHCSAGIGRSGTFCLIDSILAMVENQGSTDDIDIESTLIEMRDCRKGLIQSPVQLRFSFMAILFGVKILERANKLHPQSSNIEQTGVGPEKGTPKRGYSKTRQTRTKPTSSSQSNFSDQHLLVQALDDIDSDSADNLFYQEMRPLPSSKKLKSNGPTDFVEECLKWQQANERSGQTSEINLATRAEMLTTINSLISRRAMSKGLVLSQDSTPCSCTLEPQKPLLPTPPSCTPPLEKPLPSKASYMSSSYLLRRRELRNQQLAKKIAETKISMKEVELKKELRDKRIALIKKTALLSGVATLGCAAALLMSYVIHPYSRDGTIYI